VCELNTQGSIELKEILLGPNSILHSLSTAKPAFPCEEYAEQQPTTKCVLSFVKKEETLDFLLSFFLSAFPKDMYQYLLLSFSSRQNTGRTKIKFMQKKGRTPDTMGVRDGSVWKLLLLLAVASLAAKKSFNEKFSHPKQSLASLLPRDILGNDVRLADLEGHTYFITNVGSLHQDAENFYQQLEALQTKYGKFGLEVLVFPSHQFDDEHTSEAEIAAFASKHAPSVRLMQPIRVKVRATPPFSITSVC
jgi:glutathione peroxidase-family protein